MEADLATARRFLRALQRTCEALCDDPGLGSPRFFGNPALEGLRVWPISGFRRQLLFYRASDEAVEVVRLLHGARDLESLLGGA